MKAFASANPTHNYYSLISWRSTLLKYAPPLLLSISSISKKRTPLTTTHTLFSPLPAAIAMRKHKSQYVWYRRLWVLFSTYSYVNVLSKIEVVQQNLQPATSPENEAGRERAREIIRETGIGTRGVPSPRVRSEREDDILMGLKFTFAAVALLYSVVVKGWTILPLIVPITCAWTYIHWFGMKLFVRRE